MQGYDFLQVRDQLDKREIFGDVRNTGWHSDAIYEKFSEGEYQRRYDLTRAAMTKRGLDCIIVPGGCSAMSMGNGLVWLTGHFDTRSLVHYVIFSLEGEPTLLYAMGGSHIEAVRQAVSVKDVRPVVRSRFGEAMADRIKELKLEKGKIGLMNAISENFGAEYMPVNHYFGLKENLPDANLELIPEFFHELIYLHSEEEFNFIRKAGALCDQALQAMAERARPGVTESQLAASAAKAIQDGGGIPHFTIIAITSMENPHAIFGNPRPSGRALQEGDIILNELGAWYQGCSVQIGNPIVLGAPTNFVKDFYYEITLPGFNWMAEKLQPGLPFKEVQEAGGQFFREKGHQSRPLHLHCIDVASAGPHVSPTGVRHQGFDDIIQPGMEIMLEPCPISIDGNFGMFLGRTFIIKETGHERVTNYPMELITVSP
jgi:Xaa-Pro dipeptidase